MLTIANTSFSSRLLTGTGKFSHSGLMLNALAASGTEMVGLGGRALAQQITKTALTAGARSLGTIGRAFARGGVEGLIDGAVSGAVGEAVMTLSSERGPAEAVVFAGPHQIDADNMRVDPTRRLHPDHMGQESIIAADHLFGDPPRLHDFLFMVNVIEEGIDRAHALLNPA